MAEYDPSAKPEYNSMQQQMGLLPPIFVPPPIPFPGQVSAAMAQGGVGGAFMTAGSPGTSFGAGMFPSQQLQGFTNQGPMLQGPTGIMMPMMPGAAFNPYASANPYAGLAAHGPYQGPPGLFTPMAPSPPIPYGGQYGPGMLPLPPSPASQFNTSYMAGIERNQLSDDSGYAGRWAAGGVVARLAADFTGGIAGAYAGGRMGGKAGAVLGGLAGFMGMEMSGGGQLGQNTFMNAVASPFLQQRAMAGGIEEMSRGFVNTGGSLNAGGMGFTHHAAAQAAAGIRDMAASSAFQRETGDRFNMQDLMKVAQDAGRNDLMGGVQSAGQMTSRVRDIAKSLSSFMELAQEPDIQRAIQTMGQLRASGLNLAETNQAVAHGRAFARMAGTSFSDISAMAGAQGSQTAASMGLSQGLGMQSGMMNYALARGGQNGGTFNPQMMNLLGGAHGLANMNNMFGNSMLQMSMLAPSVMSSAGGINAQALQGLLSGRTDAFSQTSQGVGALQSIVGRQGMGGLGAAIAMQPLIQDTIGRALQAQGPFAQRNFEDRNIMNTMRQMGQTGSGGFMTMAQTLGMDRTQAVARAQELASPGYWQRQREQIEVTRSDERQTELDRREAMEPGIMTRLAQTYDLDSGRRLRTAGRSISGRLGLDHHTHYSATTDEERRREARLGSGPGMEAFQRQVRARAASMGEHKEGFLEELRNDYRIGVGETGLDGWMGGLSAVVENGSGAFMRPFGIDGRRSRESRQNAMRELREGSRQTGFMVGATQGERDSGQAALVTAFQGRAGDIQRQFAQNVNAHYRGQNDAVGFGGGMSVEEQGSFGLLANVGLSVGGLMASGAALTLGLAGVETSGATVHNRQMKGSDFRAAFIRAAVSQGQDERRAGAFYDRDPAAAMRAISTNVRLTQNDTETAQMNRDAVQSNGLGTGHGNQGRALDAIANDAQQSLFGSHSATLSDRFSEGMSRIRGVSGEGEQQDKEKSYIGAMGMLMNRQARTGGAERAGIIRQINDLQTEAQSRGILTHANRGQLDTQALAARDNFGDSEGRDLSDRFAAQQSGRSASEILTGMDAGDAIVRVRRTRQLQRGYASIASGSSVLSRRLADRGYADVSNVDVEGARGIITNASDEERRAAGITGGADEGGVTASLRASRLHDDYLRDNNAVERAWNSIWGKGEDQQVNAAMARVTAGDARADASLADINASEAQARAAGIGGANDPMVAAARELHLAAQALQSAAASGQIERINETH